MAKGAAVHSKARVDFTPKQSHVHRYLHRIILIGALSFISASCRGVPFTATPTAKSDTPTAVATYAPKPTGLGTFSLSAEQAQEVTLFMEFIRAYNAGQLDGALALLDERVVGSDCDYLKVSAILFDGKSEAAEWLRRRMADHDHLEVSRVLNENQDPSTSRHTLGVEYSRRTNDTLAKLGFVKGITPKLRSKVIFNDESTRIAEFANGPGGGDSSECRPEN
jgi:hypothetical protein